MPNKDRTIRLAANKAWRLAHKHEASFKAQHTAWYRTPRGRFASLRNSARQRRLDMTLTFDEYEVLIRDAKCWYCETKEMPVFGTGLDRTNFRIGYVHGNVVPCCAECNHIKGFLEGHGIPPFRLPELMKELVSCRGNICPN